MLRRLYYNYCLSLLFSLGGHFPNVLVVVSAETSSTNVCKPLTLRIGHTVKHRPHKLTIAHRGASAHLPEHTTAAYRLALELGADFVEPDLLATSDGTLICMHNADLAVSTDVTTKFADRQPWFSPLANRTGFWVFNFTAAEIATLTVKQTYPESRTSVYDGTFGIPTLSDVLDLLVQWNTVDLPQRMAIDEDDDPTAPGLPCKPSQLQLAHSGLYVELKDTVWLREEAGLDMVDLLLRHIATNPPWKTLLPCFDELQFDAFKVPGLVVQSFDAGALQEFHQGWQTQQEQDGSPLAMPEPPYVLLVDRDQCNEEEFWFTVGDNSRELIGAIGCDKSCLIESEVYTLTSTKAEEFSLEVHAWTERPETNFVDRRFANEFEEMRYLYCDVGVQGVFSESVSTAVTAVLLPCDTNKHGKQKRDSSENSDDDQPLCYDSADEAGLFTGVAAFVMGAFVTTLFFIGYGRHHVRWQSTVVPSAEEHPRNEGDLEMT